MNERLDKLIQQREQLDARIRKEKAKETVQARKDETRRKIVVGAIIREHIQKHPDHEFTGYIHSLLDSYVNRPKDREILGLKPRINPAADTTQTLPPDNSGTT